MATTIESIETLRKYITGVLERANHHAPNVNEIALAIAGGMMWKTTKNIKVMTRKGSMKNVLWLQVRDNTFCFVYNHNNGNIEVREKSIRGTVIQSFNNSTPLSIVKIFFEKL